jgi:hypothetical protein
MADLHRLSHEWDRVPLFERLRAPEASELNFGVIGLVLLATLAIAVALMFPEAQLAPVEF